MLLARLETDSTNGLISTFRLACFGLQNQQKITKIIKLLLKLQLSILNLAYYYVDMRIYVYTKEIYRINETGMTTYRQIKALSKSPHFQGLLEM